MSVLPQADDRIPGIRFRLLKSGSAGITVIEYDGAGGAPPPEKDAVTLHLVVLLAERQSTVPPNASGTGGSNRDFVPCDLFPPRGTRTRLASLPTPAP